MKDGPSEQKNVNVWVRKARLCGVDLMDPQHHIIYLSLFFVNEHGTTQRESGEGNNRTVLVHSVSHQHDVFRTDIN